MHGKDGCGARIGDRLCLCLRYKPKRTARSSVLRSPVARKKAKDCATCRTAAAGLPTPGYVHTCRPAPARTKRKLMPKCSQCAHPESKHSPDRPNGGPRKCLRCHVCPGYQPKRKTRSDKKPIGMRESDVGKAKRTLWKKFAAYVKARDGNQCFTCDAYAEKGDLQAGHMFPGRTGALLFDPLVVFSQCVDCNCGRRGSTAVFVDRYIKRFGVEQFQAAVARTSRDKQWRTHEVRELIAALNRDPSGAEYEALYMEKHGLDVAPATAAARGIE